MRASLLFVSLLFALCPVMAQQVSGSSTSSEYNVLMQARGNEFTALCFMEPTESGDLVGTLVNEFGIKVFDFTYSCGKAKVQNVMGPLNRWYIRRVLNRDLTFILSNLDKGENVTLKKRRLTILPGGDIKVSNERFNIHYTFSKVRLADHEADQ